MKTLTLPLDSYQSRFVALRVPERDDILNLKVGDAAPDCFGKMALVTKVNARGEDRNGRLFVHYVTALGPSDTVSNGCGCSMSMTAGELIRAVATTGAFISADLEIVEECVKSGRELPAYLRHGSVRKEVA